MHLDWSSSQWSTMLRGVASVERCQRHYSYMGGTGPWLTPSKGYRVAAIFSSVY